MNIEYTIRETDYEVHVTVRVPEHDTGPDHQYDEHYVFSIISGTTDIYMFSTISSTSDIYLEYWEQDGEGQNTGIEDIRPEIPELLGSLGYNIIQ